MPLRRSRPKFLFTLLSVGTACPNSSWFSVLVNLIPLNRFSLFLSVGRPFCRIDGVAIFLNTRPCVVPANVTGSRSKVCYLCAYVLPLAMGQFFGISTAQYNLRVRPNPQLTRRPESLPTLRRIPFEKWPFHFSNISPDAPGLGGCGRPNSLTRMPILNSNTEGSQGYQRQRDSPETASWPEPASTHRSPVHPHHFKEHPAAPGAHSGTPPHLPKVGSQIFRSSKQCYQARSFRNARQSPSGDWKIWAHNAAQSLLNGQTAVT